ncbi:calcium-binding protein [Antarctobacter sp.]|uniref:calcium-binding protein n=1 Tax=Antarctobacter sp. TaxID=1872577 RepID=UPI003A91A0B1
MAFTFLENSDYFYRVGDEYFKIDGEVDAHSNSSGTQISPVVETLSDGRYIIAWIEADSGRIAHRYVNASGDAIGGVHYNDIPFGNTIFGELAIAPLGNGGFRMAATFVNASNTAAAVQWAEFSASGDQVRDWQVSSQSVNSGAQAAPTFIDLGNGRSLLAWSNFESLAFLSSGDPFQVFDGNLYGNILGADGTTVTGAFQLNNLNYGLATGSAAANLGNGYFVVAWHDIGTNPQADEMSIKMQIFNQNGIKVGSEIVVNSTYANNQSNPEISSLGDGRFVVVWQDASFDSGVDARWDVRAQVFQYPPPNDPNEPFLSGSIRIGGEILVNANFTPGTQRDPAVAPFGDDAFIVTWTDESGLVADPSTGVVGQIITNNGIRIGQPFGVNSVLAGPQEASKAAGLGSNALVAWMTTDPGGDSDIAYQFFHAHPAEKRLTPGSATAVIGTEGSSTTVTATDLIDMGDGTFLWAELASDNTLRTARIDRFDLEGFLQFGTFAKSVAGTVPNLSGTTTLTYSDMRLQHGPDGVLFIILESDAGNTYFVRMDQADSAGEVHLLVPSPPVGVNSNIDLLLPVGTRTNDVEALFSQYHTAGQSTHVQSIFYSDRFILKSSLPGVLSLQENGVPADQVDFYLLKDDDTTTDRVFAIGVYPPDGAGTQTVNFFDFEVSYNDNGSASYSNVEVLLMDSATGAPQMSVADIEDLDFYRVGVLVTTATPAGGMGEIGIHIVDYERRIVNYIYRDPSSVHIADIQGVGVETVAPQIARISDSQVVVVWFELVANVPQILMQRFDINGTRIGPEVQVATDVGLDLELDVSILYDGYFPDNTNLLASSILVEYVDSAGDRRVRHLTYEEFQGLPAADPATPTYGPDFLVGGAAADVIAGLGGNDTILGNAGNDTLTGGGGDDEISGGLGADSLDGSPGGSDTLDYSDATGVVNVRLWNNTVVSADPLASGDTILNFENVTTGAGGDLLSGNHQGNVLSGNDGNDSLFGNGGMDILYGGNGLDLLDGGLNDDRLLGGADADRLQGGAGNDTLDGGSGNDTLIGGTGDDRLVGNIGTELLDGSPGGSDTLDYSNATGGLTLRIWNNTVVGDPIANGDTILNFENAATGSGNDLLAGNFQNNVLAGNGGNDSIYGYGGADVLVGGSGTDVIRGGIGNDTISGGLGLDYLSGEADADVFLFETAAEAGIGAQRDQVMDFVRGVDLIDVSGMVAGVFAFRGTAAFASSGAPELRLFETATGSTIVQVDVDGNGAIDAEIRVANVVGLTASDFVL